MTLAISGKSFVSRNFMVLLTGVTLLSIGCVGEAGAVISLFQKRGIVREQAYRIL